MWLAREIDELFAAGPVGLYELIWFLNGPEYDLPLPRKLEIARTVAREIIRSGRAMLYQTRWPTDAVTGGPFGEDVLENPDSFPAEPDELFLALIPHEDAPR